MTSVSILPVPTPRGGVSFLAVAGDKRSQGATAGEALDAITSQLPDSETGTVVVLQNLRPDQFFPATQQQRLAELMSPWRSDRDQRRSLPQHLQAELESLIDAELQASADRTAAIVDEIGT
jgi:hypothetical protein